MEYLSFSEHRKHEEAFRDIFKMFAKLCIFLLRLCFFRENPLVLKNVIFFVRELLHYNFSILLSIYRIVRINFQKITRLSYSSV